MIIQYRLINWFINKLQFNWITLIILKELWIKKTVKNIEIK